MGKKKFLLKVILMNEETSELFDKGKLKAIRHEEEKASSDIYVKYDTIWRQFNTQDERQAFIDGMQTMCEGSGNELLHYEILNNHCKI